MGLSEFLETQMLGFIIVFARLGSALVFMPGIGEQTIPVRHRLFFAFALSAGLFPATPVSGPVTFDPVAFFPLLAMEITIGIWIG